MRNAECDFGFLCVAGTCTSCDELPAEPNKICPDSQQPISLIRNGCLVDECAPFSECESDVDCPDGLVCYAGLHCFEGKDGNPQGCFGNVCAALGCPKLAGTYALDAPELYCETLGCLDGKTCKGGCAPTCKCDEFSGTWDCGSGCGSCAF
jgi:hypothetical protein